MNSFIRIVQVLGPQISEHLHTSQEQAPVTASDNTSSLHKNELTLVSFNFAVKSHILS